MNNSILKIADKQDLMNKIDFIHSQGVFANETLADVLIYYYVYGELLITDMSKQEIYNICIKIYCEQIGQGAINSKFKIAEELSKKENLYISSDKILADFLIHISSCENSSGACVAISEKFFEIGRKDLAYYWQKKSMMGTSDKIGLKLNLEFDTLNKKIIFSEFNTPNTP